MVIQEEARKGPWTEQEDVQLAFYVNLFGDRRWDFIAKVSGLKRTGKSCRLRWVNYMHPGLVRGKLSPQEERLVVQLYSKWGNRWSKIARKVPGRTDNDIKNYWRTHMRKEAEDHKKNKIMSSSSSSLSSISSSYDSPAGADSAPAGTTGQRNSYDTGGLDFNMGAEQLSMNEIWKDIALPEEDNIIDPVLDSFKGEWLQPTLEGGFPCTTTATLMATSIWDDNYYSNNTSLWSMDPELYPGESNIMMMPSMIDHQQFD